MHSTKQKKSKEEILACLKARCHCGYCSQSQTISYSHTRTHAYTHTNIHTHTQIHVHMRTPLAQEGKVEAEGEEAVIPHFLL
jgi:hypothetical protein